MEPRSVIKYLVKAVAFYVLALVAWQTLGLGWAYHTLLAAVLGATYPGIDPAGVVQGAAVEGKELILRIAIAGKPAGLNLNAADVTSNAAMLIALYAASPVQNRWKRFAAYFAAAASMLFIVHLVTFFTVSQEAFMGHPDIRAAAGFTSARLRNLTRINVFYEEMGMYLVVLLLWFPYLLLWLRKPRPDPQ